MAALTGHYTAILKIEHIVPAHEATHDDYNKTRYKVERNIREVSNIVVRADDLNALISKTTAHLALVEDYTNN